MANNFLDFELAWKRAKLDRPNRTFVTYPHLISWIESDLASWFAGIQRSFEQGYAAHPSITCDVPKGNWMVRPGSVLDLRDEVVVNAILGRFHKELWTVLGSSQGDPDIAYQFQRDAKQVEWVRSGFHINKQWREKSLAKLNKATRFVVFADISAFYENVDLQRINSDLRGVGFDEDSLRVLMDCLRRWSSPRDKGIPQGYSASDVLAKVYLNRLDKALRTDGFQHLRYVDDIRIFCRTSLEAKRALLRLNQLLRNSGLNLQTAKTEILPRESARMKIDGVKPTIDAIQDQLAEELRSVWSLSNASGTLSDIDAILTSSDDSPRLEVLERAFHDSFSSGSDRDFDKTLLHYLLARLGRARSRVAVAYCIDLLSTRAEETSSILRYFENLNLGDQEIAQIVAYAGSPEALYDYQLFEIVRWFVRLQLTPSVEMLDLSRRWWHDRNRAPWLRSWSLALLGLFGDISDLENIEHSYSAANTDIENAEIISATSRVELSRRNAFHKRVGDDAELVRLAVAAAKKGLHKSCLSG